MNFYTLEKSGEAIYRDKGSKFISFVVSVTNEEEIQQELKRVRSKFPDATHHCYAWRINPENVHEFAQDDGEPSGTAGNPILNRLRSFQLINSLGIVVRYYGGTNLGKGGLIKAYSESTQLALEGIALHEIQSFILYTITYPYSESKHVELVLSTHGLKTTESDYTDEVKLQVACAEGKSQDFEQNISGLAWLGVSLERGKRKFISGTS